MQAYPTHLVPETDFRLLFVDDEPAVRRLFQSELKSLGLTADVAATVAEARELLAQHRYSTVAVDVHLPGIPGLDLVRELAVTESRPHLVLVTGDHEVVVPQGLAVDAVIHKPWSTSDWTEVLPMLNRTQGKSNVRTALVVEDSDADANFLERLLGESVHPIETTRVCRLSDALDHLSASSWDVIVADLALPDARRVDVVRRLLRRDPTQALIVVSGSSSDSLAKESIRLGADDFLPKADVSASTLNRAIDLATERRHWTCELFELARLDALTGLSSRRFFESRLDHALLRAARTGRGIGVIYVDLDGFKQVNDTLGHNAGDDVLREVANRLISEVRLPDSIGRIGGDEFAIVLESVNDKALGERVGERIRQSLEVPIVLAERSVNISGSVGLAMSPEDGDSATLLLHAADKAMYRAKGQGGNQVGSTGTPDEGLSETQPADYRLRKALDLEEFHMVYQPCWDVDQGQFAVAESLLRWSPRLGEGAPPNQFIPELEALDQMPKVGRWAMDTCCRELAAWREAGLSTTMAVNLSPVQFEDKRLVSNILDTLERYDLSAADLELEITESVIIKEIDQAGEQLKELRDHGATVALDDFGTGYSSLAYLHRFPVDVLKIDRSFISDIEHSKGARTLVESIVGLGHNLGLQVVAEGVENEVQRDFLVDNGCDRLQGYFYSHELGPAMALECLG